MYKAMIIDDEPWVLARLRSICSWNELGFELISQESDPALAWLNMQRLKPDVVFTDINMPLFSGLEIIQTARQRGIDAEFIIISGYDDFSYAQKAIENGVFHYFLKPVNSGEFVSVLQKLKRKLDLARQSTALPEDIAPPPRTENSCLNSILEYIHANYTQQFGLAELSREFFVSHTYICDLFNKHLDTTFIKYLNSVRLEAAERLLAGSDALVSQVALESGFRDYSYFSKLYRKQYGMTPSAYRTAYGKGERK